MTAPAITPIERCTKRACRRPVIARGSCDGCGKRYARCTYHRGHGGIGRSLRAHAAACSARFAAAVRL